MTNKILKFVHCIPNDVYPVSLLVAKTIRQKVHLIVVRNRDDNHILLIHQNSMMFAYFKIFGTTTGEKFECVK